MVGAAVNLTLDDAGTCTAARVVLGAVAPTPVVVAPMQPLRLIGSKVDDAALEQDGSGGKRGLQPHRATSAARSDTGSRRQPSLHDAPQKRRSKERRQADGEKKFM